MIKPLWALAGTALLGATGIVGAIVVSSPGGEEEVVQQVEAATPTKGAAKDPRNTPTQTPSPAATPAGGDPNASPAPGPIAITIRPIGDSGQSGTAVIGRAAKGFEIDVSISGFAPGAIHAIELRWSQPHNMQCDFPESGAVIYKLSDLIEGRSTTEIDDALYTFGSNAPYVIVVRSADWTGQPVACGAVNREDFITLDSRTRDLVPAPKAQGPGPHMIPVEEIFFSGESGRAVIEQIDGVLEIYLTISGQPRGVDQPVDIRWSQPYNWCSFPVSGGVAYRLNDLSEGVSTTRINADLSVGPYVIVVYESHEQPEVPVACAVIGELLP